MHLASFGVKNNGPLADRRQLWNDGRLTLGLGRIVLASAKQSRLAVHNARSSARGRSRRTLFHVFFILFLGMLYGVLRSAWDDARGVGVGLPVATLAGGVVFVGFEAAGFAAEILFPAALQRFGFWWSLGSKLGGPSLLNHPYGRRLAAEGHRKAAPDLTVELHGDVCVRGSS